MNCMTLFAGSFPLSVCRLSQKNWNYQKTVLHVFQLTTDSILYLDYLLCSPDSSFIGMCCLFFSAILFLHFLFGFSRYWTQYKWMLSLWKKYLSYQNPIADGSSGHEPDPSCKQNAKTVSNTLDNNINTKSNGNSFFWKKDVSKYIGKVVWIAELLPPASAAAQHAEQQ